MKLSTKGRYAVMAMVELAARKAGDTPTTLAEIAKSQEISLSYLEQLFGRLRRGGLVNSVRGPGGGYTLSRPSDQIRISEIVHAVDETLRATRCMGNPELGCRKDGSRCQSHELWAALSDQIRFFLGSVSLADVVEKRVIGGGAPLAAQAARAEIAAE